MKKVFIVGMARTPIGAFQGALSTLSAPKLGSQAIMAALQRAGVPASEVSEVIMGNVLTAGIGQAPARQAALGAGLPDSVPCLTVNKVCGSGMKAIMLGMQSIQCGDADLVVAGGMECMSQAPYLLPQARDGYRMGNNQAIDSMIHDGLWDPYHNQHMGNCGDLCAEEMKFSRHEQDQFAIESFRRAQAAQKNAAFLDEIVPVKVASRKGEVIVTEDEGPAKGNFEKIPQLKPAFSPKGTVTAANASTINDGAAAVVLVSEDKLRQAGLRPLAEIKSYASHARKPLWFTTAPATAMKSAMDKIQWSVNQIDLFEVNEAFAVVAMAAQRELNIPADKLNVHGGAISLGHPIGASGCRIVITLVSALKRLQKRRGVAGICIGGGEATALCVERV